MELFSVKQAGFKLRGYQEDATNASVDFLLRKGKSKRHTNGIVVAPTAAGKSIIIAKTAELAEGRVVVMQPSKELLLQNHDKFTRLGFEAGIYSASAKRKDTDRVTFVTPGSVVDCGSLFKGCKLIIDEAHLFPPRSSSMIGRFMQAAGVEKTLGYTATPFRLDKDELKFLTRMRPALFGSIQHVIQVSEMTSGGYWSKMKYKSIPFDNKHLRMNTAGSDYTEASMRKSYEESGTAETINHICKVAREHGRKSILVFVPSVADAQALEKSIPGLKAVWGDMKTDDRDNVISGFKDGSIQVVANVNVLSVGFDHPGVDCIIMARPTMSLAWY